MAAGTRDPHFQGAIRVNDLPDYPPVDFLVQDVIARGMTNMIYGMGGSLKTILGLHLATSVAAGADYWLGHKVDPAPAMVIDVELDARAQKSRMEHISRGLGLSKMPDSLFYTTGTDRDIRTVLQQAIEDCDRYGIKFLVLDSLTWAMGGDVSDAAVVLDFMTNYITPFENAGISLLALDHVSKPVKGVSWRDQTPFGSVFKFNKGRCIWQVHGDRPKAGDTGRDLVFRHEKSNFGPILDEHVVRANFSKGLINIVRTDKDPADITPETTEERAMRALQDGPMFPTELADLLRVKRQTAKDLVSQLRKQGKVVDTGMKDGQARQVKLASEYDPATLFHEKDSD